MTALPLILLLHVATPALPVAAPGPVAAPSAPAQPPAPPDSIATTLPATPPAPATTEDCHCGVPNSPRGPR